MFSFGKPTLLKALISIFEKDNNRTITPSEISVLQQAVEELPLGDCDTSDFSDPEIERMLIEDIIEEIVHSIRMVVVCYIECLKSPYPYILKKNLEYIKEYHAKVLSFYNSEHYQEAVKCAYKDMFQDDMRLLDHIQESKDLFVTYADYPMSLSISPIIHEIPSEYSDCINEKWFSILPE